jgi:hypothetical protein
MSLCGKLELLSLALLAVCTAPPAFGQSQTVGQITGTVRDIQGRAIPNASILAVMPATGEKQKALTNDSGNYVLLALSPGNYELTITAPGFATSQFLAIHVPVGDTAVVHAVLQIAQVSTQIAVNEIPPLIRTGDAQLATTLDERSLSALPLATRNFLQALALSPGVSTFLTDNSAVGRNSPNVSVNGARASQNSFQLNGTDAASNFDHDAALVAVPAPESIEEVSIRTSLYDASLGSAAGAQIQVVTKSGSNQIHGTLYEYFRNDALNANDPNLKAVDVPRPILRRNVFGGTLGGPLRKDKLFYFISYQGTRDRNGATDQSLYRNVLIAPGLSDDRSESTLLATFHPTLPDGTPAPSINPVSLNLLSAHLADGKFLIPTPQTADGRVSGTAVSTYQEEQFNINLDLHRDPKNSFSFKVFFSNSPDFYALGDSLLPGFGSYDDNSNRVLAFQHVHTFSGTSVNELRLGYNFIRNHNTAEESILDSEVGISRPTADVFPGLPRIVLAPDAASLGSPGLTIDIKDPSASLADVFSFQRGQHRLRVGGDLRYYRTYGRANVNAYGEIDFASFNDFLTGNTLQSLLSSGISDRNFITTDCNLFVQDDWNLSPHWTLNLGLRYELDLPPYDSRGRLSTFDPSLYQPRLQVDDHGYPIGPPASGIVQAGNAIPAYDLPDIPNVGKRLLKSVDPNNFAPRVGLAWSPLQSRRLVFRGGYGIFYSRPSMWYIAYNFVTPPFFLAASSSGAPFDHPFPDALPASAFPVLSPGPLLAGNEIDRSMRTPYLQQFNASTQWEAAPGLLLDVAYVGTRGVGLLRYVAINQAPLASPANPIGNAVTGEVITLNTNENALLRAPFQGVATDQNSFILTRSDGQSTFHSLQANLSKHASHGLQFFASYTFSKSMDDGSGPGGGALPSGAFDRGSGGDSSSIIGNQLDPRGNRGLSDFDRTHRFVLHGLWDLPAPASAQNRASAILLSGWQFSGMLIAMSGVPVDIFDPLGGSLYGLLGARPSWAPGLAFNSAKSNIPAGYAFNPYAFAESVVQPYQPIPSAHDPLALAGDLGTDIGNVGRNILRGPRQTNVDLSVAKFFSVRESAKLEFRADFFKLLNHANGCNPVSDISVVAGSGGSMDPNTGRILSAGDFGRILSACSSPRIVQFSLKLNF